MSLKVTCSQDLFIYVGKLAILPSAYYFSFTLTLCKFDTTERNTIVWAHGSVCWRRGSLDTETSFLLDKLLHI